MTKIWKIGGAALLGLVGIGAALWLIGLAMPQDHVATCVALLAGGESERGDAWELVANPAAYPDWRVDVREIRIAEDPRVHDVRFVEVGDQGAVEYGLDLIEAPQRAASTILTQGMPYDGAWEFDLDHAEGYVRIEVTERGSVYSPLFRVLGRYVFGYTSSMQTYLGNLAAALDLPTDMECVVL